MAHLLVDDDVHSQVKLVSIKRKFKSANAYLKYLIDLDKRNQKTIKDISNMQPGDVYAFEYPDRLVNLKCEGNFVTHKLN